MSPFVLTPARTARNLAVGDCIQNDGQHNEHHTGKQQSGAADRIGGVIHDHAENQSDTDAHGKRDRHARYINRGDQKNVGEIENRAAQQCGVNAGMENMSEIGKERLS